MIGLAALLALAAAAAAAAALRRRRTERAGALAAPLRAGPAGVRHLAASVSELSDMGLHLPVPAGRKGRVGSPLGLR